MNDKGFLFVTCVNNLEEYHYCRAHIDLLEVPADYEIDFLFIDNAKSMAEGYNRALQHHFKYKIYLHQDTHIINRTLLFDIVNLFSNHPKLGMIGVAGCKQLPDNGKWWEGDNLYGKVIDIPETYRLLSFNQTDGLEPYTVVEAIDGLLMITQKDIPWREDLFKGFHYYDISHSFEMSRHGFDVGVPKMENPWCIHDSGKYLDVEAFEIARTTFLEEYMTENKEVSKESKMDKDAYEGLYEQKNSDYFKGLNVKLFQKISPNSTTILEVGCSEGKLGAYIQQQYNAKVYGIELFPEAADQAKQKLTDVIIGDIEKIDLPYPEQFFDHIIFGDVLEHLKNPWAVLEKLKPYLKKNGTILACIPHIGHISSLVELIAGNWNYTKNGIFDQTHLRFFTRSTILELFNSTGYVIKEIDSISSTNQYFEQWISHLIPLRKLLLMGDEPFTTDVRTYQFIVTASIAE